MSLSLATGDLPPSGCCVCVCFVFIAPPGPFLRAALLMRLKHEQDRHYSRVRAVRRKERGVPCASLYCFMAVQALECFFVSILFYPRPDKKESRPRRWQAGLFSVHPFPPRTELIRAEPTRAYPSRNEPNQTEPNPTELNPTQPNPTQPTPTQSESE